METAVRNQRRVRIQDEKEEPAMLQSALQFLSTAVSEFFLVVYKAVPLCIVLAFVSLQKEKRNWFGYLYMPLKTIAVIKMLLLAPYDDISYIAIITDVVSCYIVAAIRLDLQANYLVLDMLDDYKYGYLYKFFMGLTWSLQIDFMVRTVRLLIDAAYKLIQFQTEDR